MNDSKPAVKSLTVQASLVAVTLSVVGLIRLVYGGLESGELLTYIETNVADAITHCTVIASGLAAVYGRFRATTKLTSFIGEGN